MVVQTMPAAIEKTAAAAKTGRQRAPSQSSSGKRKLAGSINEEDPARRAKANPLVTAVTATATLPSSSSRQDGRSRAAATTPIKSGATVTAPSTSAANQTFQTSRKLALAGTNSCIAPEATVAAAAVATLTAAKNPRTPRRLSRLKAGPSQRAINHIANSASPALHKPNASALEKLLSTATLAATVAAITPAATGTRAKGPSATSMPMAMPEAGQKTATGSAVVRSTSPSRAARK